MLRFAPNRVLHRSFTTRFVNVSETGLAFLIDKSSAPQIGEFIKVEFPVPGGEQIAWFAKVVRLETFSPFPWWSDKRNEEHTGDILVGVQFHQLPNGHRQAIRFHLQNKFHDVIRQRQMARWTYLKMFIVEYGWQILMYAIAVAFTVSVLYFLSRPSPNYDPKRGAPWGQRFKTGD